MRNEWHNIDRGETKDEINKKKLFTRYDYVMGTPNTKHEEYQYEGIRIINLKDWLVQKVNTYTYYIYNI